MTAMVLGPDGCPLGLGAQSWWTRRQRKRLSDCRRRAWKDKESRYWLELIDNCRSNLHSEAPNTKPCFVLDRGGDIQQVLLHAAERDVALIVRSRHNRRLVRPGEVGKRWRKRGALLLADWVAQQPVAGHHVAKLRRKRGSGVRLVRLQVRFGKVKIFTQDRRSSRLLDPVEVHVVDVQEVGRGRKGLHWRLLTTLSVQSLKDAKQVLFGYTLRWRIEQFHRTWKTGTCNVERNQLRSVSALTAWATLLAVVATRIERIKHLSRKEPDRPATRARRSRMVMSCPVVLKACVSDVVRGIRYY